MQLMFNNVSGVMYCDSLRESCHIGTDKLCNNFNDEWINPRIASIFCTVVGFFLMF